MNWRVALLLLLVVPAWGCAGVEVTDGDRGLEHQNRQAAEHLLAMPDLPLAVRATATDIHANSSQLAKNFGEPKDKKVLQPYSTAASEALRKQSEQEHRERESSKTWLFVGGSAALAAVGWILRASSLGSIPVLGPLIAKLSPRIANGAVANEKIAQAAMTVIDKVRDRLDKKEPITGPEVVEMVRAATGDAGVLKENTSLYDATNTGVS